MTYPKHLYRHPGIYGAGHRSYGVIGANDEATEAALIEQGWYPDFESLWRSVDGEAEAVVEAAEALEDAIDEVSPATRDELEQQAEKLGLPFNSRTKDEVLVARIAEAMD